MVTRVAERDDSNDDKANPRQHQRLETKGGSLHIGVDAVLRSRERVRFWKIEVDSSADSGGIVVDSSSSSFVFVLGVFLWKTRLDDWVARCLLGRLGFLVIGAKALGLAPTWAVLDSNKYIKHTTYQRLDRITDPHASPRLWAVERSYFNWTRVPFAHFIGKLLVPNAVTRISNRCAIDHHLHVLDRAQCARGKSANEPRS